MLIFSLILLSNIALAQTPEAVFANPTPAQVLDALQQAGKSEQVTQAVNDLTQKPQQVKQQVHEELERHSQQLEDTVSKQAD